ncbi:MAG TPA: MBL fold metallo-hydrolase, partial [Actinomycetota bacterium]
MSTSAWPFGAYPPRGLDPLGPNVTAYHAGGFPASNSAIVRGRDATLVFDANCFRFADELRAAVDKAGPPVRDLVLSHAHDDHTMGAERFAPPARVLARASACARLQRNVVEGSAPGVQYERGYPGAAEEGRRVRIVVPEREIERPETVELGGGVRVHLRPEEPAHTDGDLWAFVEPDDVILCGDLWYVDCEPYVGSGSVRGLLRAIGRIREAGARVHLPGHGPAGRLGPASTDPVERHLAWVL